MVLRVIVVYNAFSYSFRPVVYILYLLILSSNAYCHVILDT